MDNVSLMVMGLFMVMTILIILSVIIIIKLSRNDSKGSDVGELRREMRDEIDRSRQETIDIVQKSIRNLGDMISQNQRESAESQSRRLMELNRQFTDTLEQVTRGLGEMQSLAAGVGDLKKVLSNVKTRGILGEIQLGAILEQILAPEQYEENVAVSGTSERVEFAVKFPGEGKEFVYLPIDSKFPADAYSRLLDAYDTGEKTLIKTAGDGLRSAVLKAAKDISTKYILPPATTEFAIMFLPFEGLYAEVLRQGIVEQLQRDYRVTIAGPTTMAAMLNSFQMGFRSLALQKHSGEVWNTLAKVRTEFDKFGDVLTKTQTKMEQAQKDLETLVGVRTRGIQRALKNVSEKTEKLDTFDE
ncbi:MAG: DNA recombination protein RmuC [Anaerovoracaceae bacterium]|nr:DNA recombination protein RmuC [Anaerovoracaceae bacterium]